MKKSFKIVGIICLVLVATLLLLPFVFQGKMTKIVKEQGSEMIQGEFDFASLDMSFFAHFPKATISLNDFWIRGEGVFKKDTLAKIDELSVTVDLLSLFGQQYNIENIYLQDASFKAVVAKNGKANWDIMEETSEVAQPEDSTITTTAFDVVLKRVIVKRMSVVYDDRQGGTLQAFDDINMNVSAVLQNDRYELTNSSFEMKGLKAYAEGWVAMPEGKEMDYDIDLKTDNATLDLLDMPNMHVAATHLHVTPKLLTLTPTKLTIAHSDMTIDCVVRNIGKYVIDKGVLSGKMNLTSKLLNLNDFMSDEEAVGETAGETTGEESLSVIEVPSNIDIVVNAKVQQIKIKAMKLTQLTGQLLAKNKKLTMKNLAFDVMKGQVKMNGVYATKNKNKPTMDAELSMKNISFVEAYKGSEIAKKLVPLFSHAHGTFSSSVSLGMLLDKEMSPVMNSVQAKGRIRTDDLIISDMAVLDKLAKVLKKPTLARIKTKDLNVGFTVKDGLVTTAPFKISIGKYKMILGGQTGLDQTINYDATVVMPKGHKVLGLSEVNLAIGGTFEKPSVKVNSKKLIENLFQSTLKSLTNKKSSGKNNVVEQGVSLLKGLFK